MVAVAVAESWATVQNGSSSAEADVTSAGQSSAAYAVQSCNNVESFRRTAQCSRNMIDFSIRS